MAMQNPELTLRRPTGTLRSESESKFPDRFNFSMEAAVIVRPFQKIWITGAIVVTVACWMASPARAGYGKYGLGMDVQTGTVVNGALHVQCVNDLWSTDDGRNFDTNTYINTFTGFACDDYAKAWLVTAVYGSSSPYTAKITATVNGNIIASPTVGNPGGVNDANPNVYGSSVAGVWVLSLPINPSYLYTSGSANVVSVVVSDKSTDANGQILFDGRSYYQTLVTISRSASLVNTLDYAFAAGGGDIGTSTGYVTSRTLNLGAIGSQPISQADLYATYIYGDAGQKDKLLLNGVSLLGDDVANKTYKNGTGASVYLADSVYAKVLSSNLFAVNNLLKFTVNPADFSSSSGSKETSLRPELAVLGVTHPTPSLWAGNANVTDWGDPGNWNNGVPKNPGDTAAFGTSIGAGTATVNLNGNRTLSSMTFSNSQGGTFTISQGSSGSLTLANNGSQVSITVSNDGGHHAIDVPLILQDDLAVRTGTGTTLTISSQINEITGNHKSLLKTGPGELILSGTGNYTGGTVVSGGTLLITNRAALPDGQSLSIGAGSVVIFDPSLRLNSAPLLLTGRSASLADLIRTEPVAPLAASPAMLSTVPEPGTLTLLVTATFLCGAWRLRRVKK